MSRILLIFTMALFLFSSCGEEGKQTLSGADNPLSEWTIPVSVKAAGEGNVAAHSAVEYLAELGE
jgi:hypothetical protein